MRFCGNYSWRAATGALQPWPNPALLGAGALDWKSPSSSRLRLAVWSPRGDASGPGHVAAHADVAVVFAGYLQALPPGITGEAAHVLERYRAGDHDWIRSADGVFAFALVDAARDRCLLGVDRLGIRPLYYSHDARSVTFSGTLAAAVCWDGRRLEPDHDTLQELMVLGFPLTGRTFLRGVERVEPGTVVEVGPNGRQVRRYWSLEQLSPIRPQGVEAYLDESRARLRRTLARLLAREPATLCLLSSGYDSRRLILEAADLGGRLVSATAIWPFPGQTGVSIEPAVTGELCRRLGVAHRMVAAPGPGQPLTPSEARRMRDLLLDFQVYGRDHVWAVPLAGALGAADPPVNLDGLAGDTLFNNPFYALPRAVWGRWRPEREVLDAIAPARDAEDRRWQGLVSCPLSRRLHDALEALPAGPNRLPFFYLLGRTRAVVALLPYGLLDERVESYCPYLDNDVVDHALSFDPVQKGEARLQRLALRRHFPSFADLPTSHSPPSEVAATYLTPLDHVDPLWLGRFTPPEVLALLTPAQGRLPAADAGDLAFAGLSMAGLARLGGGWREPRVRDRLQALRALSVLAGGDPRPALHGRARATAALAACGAEPTAPRGAGSR